jgi:hypothetical protein
VVDGDGLTLHHRGRRLELHPGESRLVTDLDDAVGL